MPAARRSSRRTSLDICRAQRHVPRPVSQVRPATAGPSGWSVWPVRSVRRPHPAGPRRRKWHAKPLPPFVRMVTHAWSCTFGHACPCGYLRVLPPGPAPQVRRFRSTLSCLLPSLPQDRSGKLLQIRYEHALALTAGGLAHRAPRHRFFVLQLSRPGHTRVPTRTRAPPRLERAGIRSGSRLQPRPRRTWKAPPRGPAAR